MPIEEKGVLDMIFDYWLKPLLDPGPYEFFDLGDFQLTTGYTLPNAKLAYKTHGNLTSAQGKAILFPHQIIGTPESLEEIFIGPGLPLDPANYFIILPGQFSAGHSSSPSNTPPPFNQGAFPPITFADDVRAQYKLVTERFQISELYAVLGWSGGAAQAYEWAVRYPSMVKRAAVFSGPAKTPVNSRIFTRLAQELLQSDPAWNGGFYADPHKVQVGLRRTARAFSLMGLTSEFYRQETWRKAGYSSPEDFITRVFEAQFLALDPNDLLGQYYKWSNVDVSVNAKGDLAAALGAITAKTFVVSFTGDRIITRQDCEAEAALITNAQLRFIDSVWGHNTMLSPVEEDREAIYQVLGELLA